MPSAGPHLSAAPIGTRQQRQQHDHLGPAHTDHRVDVGAPGIEVMDLQSSASGAGLGEVGEAPGGEVVDDVDLLAFGEQAIDQMGADESRLPRSPALRIGRIPSASSDQSVTQNPRGGHGIVDETSTVVDATIRADHAADDRRAGTDDAHHERPFDAGLGFDRRAGKDHRVDDRALAADAGAGTHDAVLDQRRGVDVGRVVDRRARGRTGERRSSRSRFAARYSSGRPASIQ